MCCCTTQVLCCALVKMAALVAEERWVGIDLGGDRSTTVLQSGECRRQLNDTATLHTRSNAYILTADTAVPGVNGLGHSLCACTHQRCSLVNQSFTGSHACAKYYPEGARSPFRQPQNWRRQQQHGLESRRGDTTKLVCGLRLSATYINAEC